MSKLNQIFTNNQKGAAVLSFVLPFAALIERGFATASAVLALFGLYLWMRHRSENNLAERVFRQMFFIGLGFLIIFLLERYFEHGLFEIIYFKYIDSYARFFLLMPLFFVGVYGQFNSKYLLYGIAAALFFMCTYSFYQMMQLKLPRSFGTYGYENLYACVQFSYCLLLLIYSEKINFSILLVGVFSGMSSIFMTETRGVWLLLPSIVLWLTIIGCKKNYQYSSINIVKFKRQWFKKMIYFTAVSLMLIVLAWVMTGKLQQRYLQTKIEIASMETKKWSDSSIGTRVDLWMIGLKLAEKNPLIGGGWGAFKEHLTKLAAENKVPKHYASFQGPHNLIFLAMGEHGYLVGLLFLGFIFIFPLLTLFYYRKLININNGYMCITFLISFGLMAMSESIIERHAGMHWFAVFWLTSFGFSFREKKIG